MLGSWPTFHDVEVLTVALDRSGSEGPTLEASILVVRQDGRNRDPWVATIRFHDMAELEMEGVNHQNVLFELVLDRPESTRAGRIHLDVPTSPGLSASFDCARCEVVEVARHPDSAGHADSAEGPSSRY